MSKRKVWGVLVVALLAVLLLWKLPVWQRQAEIGAAYGARIGCSCRYVEGREIASCERDFEPGMGMVSLSDDDASHTVTASVPLLASRSATLQGESGCILTPQS